MTVGADVTLAVALACSLYPYLGYPALLKLLSLGRRVPPEPRAPTDWPLISITIPAYNEAATISETIERILQAHGMSSAQAAAAAMGETYQVMVRQAAMLSYKNAFAILGAVVFVLAPLPFLMRLPDKRRGAPPPEEAMGH